jgi:hypothetical protein
MFESCLRNYKWSKFLYTKGLRPLIVYGRYGDSDGSSDALLVVFNVSAVQLLHVICCSFNKSFQSFGESLFVLTP